MGIINGVRANATNLNNAFAEKSTLTTKGDLFVKDASVVNKIGVGTDGQVLTADSALSLGIKWASPSTSTISAVRSVVTTDTATTADDVLILSGASFTQTLFTAVGNDGKVLEIKHNGTDFSQIYTIDAAGSETIGSNLDYLLYTNGESVKIISDGANWVILRSQTTSDTYSSTITIGAETTPPTKGTIVTDIQYYWREGRYLVVSLNYNHSGGSPAVGDGDYLFTVPGGQLIDTLRAPTNTETGNTHPRAAMLGACLYNASGASQSQLWAATWSSTQYRLMGLIGGANNVLSSTAGGFNNANVYLGGTIKIPISGWNP